MPVGVNPLLEVYAIIILLLLINTTALCQPTVATRCLDSSVHIRYVNSTGEPFEVMQQVTTADGGRIALGMNYASHQTNAAIVIKFDSDGSVRWSKKIIPAPPYPSVFINQICEAENGNIALAGQINQQYYYLAILDSNGQMVKQSIPNFANIPFFSSTDKETHIITKLSADSLLFLYFFSGARIIAIATDNQGNIGSSTIFKAATINYDQVVIQKTRTDGRFLWLYCSAMNRPFCEGQNNESSILFIKVDLVSRQVVLQKQFCTPLATNAYLFSTLYDFYGVSYRTNNGKYYFDRFFFLENDKIAVARAYRYITLLPKITNWLYHITYYDSAFNPLQSYHLATDSLLLKQTILELAIDSNGTQHFNFADYTNKTVYYAIADNMNRFVLQKKLSMPELGNYMFPSRMQPSERNGGFTDFTSQSIKNNHTAIDYVRINAADTGVSCFGTDTAFLRFEPASVVEHPITDQISSSPGIIQEVPLDFAVENYPMIKEDICVIKSICDTLQLHAPATVCNTLQPITITAYKNPLCKGKINFQFDTSAVFSWQQPNDTTLELSFKNKWQGYVYATASSCADLRDSAFIIVSKPLTSFTLGPDIFFCPGKPHLLKAPNGMKGYRWQNGSTDSAFVATKAGTYYVTFMDYCNIMYSDTLKIKPFPYSLTIGKDQTICKSEKIELSATEGFISYTWEPNYNITKTTGKNVYVFPEITTSYSVTGESAPGCFIRDTVMITVENCPQKFYVPSAFTPNKDGLNDAFKPIITGALSNYKFVIYNRWGQVVFATTNKSDGWDGTFRGKMQDAGSFTWVCQFQFYNKKANVEKGVVTLIK